MTKMNIIKGEIPEIAKQIGSVYTTGEYVEYAHSEGNEVYYVWDDSFLLPVVLRKLYFFKSAIFPCEVLSLHNGKDKGEKAEFLDKAIAELRSKLKIDSINGTAATSTFDIYPKESKWIPFGSHIVDLSLSEEELWSNVHSKHRNVIRRAEKDGVVFKECTVDDIQDYIKIDEQTWRRSGTNSLGANYYLNILNAMPHHSMMAIAYLNGEPQGGTILIFDIKRCYYLFAASTDRPTTGAMNYLLWRCMLLMKQKGVKEFSFVGCRINEDPDSKYHGIQSFKERFGGSLFEGYVFKQTFSPIKSFLIRVMRIIKRHSFSIPQDVIDQEWNKWH